MNIADAAMLIALEAHSGTKNKHDGELYSLHVARVVINVREIPGGDDPMCAVAWLHDVLEDTEYTYETLMLAMMEKCGNKYSTELIEEVINAVDAMTKRKGETNEQYYYRVKANFRARFVKLFGDMKDNFRRNHKIVDEETRLRMAHKYSLGVDILG